MTSARRLYRLNLALGGLGVASIAVALVVVSGNLQMTAPALAAIAAACSRVFPDPLSASSVGLLGLLSFGLLVLGRATESVLRQIRTQRRLRAGLPRAATAELEGQAVQLVHGNAPQAFCAGVLRPRVHLSTGALERLSAEELRAVLAHELHHVRRRDPLRLLVAAMLADSLFFLPALRRLEGRYRSLAELAADEAAVRAAGAPALASALLVTGRRPGREGAVALTPERVDHLLGATPRWRLERSGVSISLLAVGALLAAAFVVRGSRVDLVGLLVETCTMLMVLLPSALAVAVLWRRAPTRLSTR